MEYLKRLWDWVRSLLSKPKPIVKEPMVVWIVVPKTYEKWRHPGAKNLKHYRAVFHSSLGERRLSKRKFKTVSQLQNFAHRFNSLCVARAMLLANPH